MFVLATREQGAAAKVTSDVISGQLVKLTDASPYPPGERTCAPVGGDNDVATGVQWGLAYYDPMRFAWERPEGGAAFVDRVPSITTAPTDATAKVALNQRVTVLTGRFRGWTNQLNDGAYTPGMYLTVDTATARLKAAGDGDKIYGRVELMQRPQVVTSQDHGVMVHLSIPEGLTPA